MTRILFALPAAAACLVALAVALVVVLPLWAVAKVMVPVRAFPFDWRC